MNTAQQKRILRPRITGSDLNAKGEPRIVGEAEGFTIIFEPSVHEQFAIIENFTQSMKRKFAPWPTRNRAGQ